MKLKINMMKEQISAMEEEEEDHNFLEEPNKYSWDALLEAVSARISREGLFASMMVKKGPHRLRCNRNACSLTSTSYSNKLVEDPLHVVAVLFDYPIPKRKRGSSRGVLFDYPIPKRKRGSSGGARQQEKTLLKVSNLRREEGEVVLKRKRPREEIKEKNVKRARPLVMSNIEIPISSRNLPDGFMRKILAMGTHTNLQLVLTKRLTTTDCNNSEGRLSMPHAKIVDFLEEHEKILLEERKTDEKVGRKKIDKKNGIDVVLIQPNLNLEAIDIKLRQWYMNNSKMYVLVKPWNDVVSNNGLEAGNAIEIWSFRVDQTKLGLAIVKLPNGEEEKDVVPESTY